MLTFSFSNNTGPFETTSVLYVRKVGRSLADKIVSDRAYRCLERVNSRSMAGLHLVSSVAIRDVLRVADQIPHRGVRCCGRFPHIQVRYVVVVRTLVRVYYSLSHLHGYREKGDQSKLRDFLPADKQYLITRGVPCLRRATSLAYTDEDEDRERLLKFGDLSSTGNEADEWVETHAGRSSNHEGETVGEIDDIPDVDDGAHGVTQAMGGLSVSGSKGGAEEIPDIDDIPDMDEEDLEAGDDEATAAAPKAAAPASSGVIDPRCAAQISALTHSV